MAVNSCLQSSCHPLYSPALFYRFICLAPFPLTTAPGVLAVSAQSGIILGTGTHQDIALAEVSDV
jgi:hypothetical protein